MSNDLIKVITVLTEALISAHTEIEVLKEAAKNVVVSEPVVNTPPVSTELTATELRDQLSQAFEANGLINELAAAYDAEQERAIKNAEREKMENVVATKVAKAKLIAPNQL